MKKRLLAFALSAVNMCTYMGITAYAKYEPPKEIWASFNKYAAAIESDDYSNIIKYGLIDLSILEKEEPNETVDNWICARYQHIGEAYEKLGDYVNSAAMYEKQIPYAQKLGWTDSEKIARAKAKNYKSDIMIFETTNEPQNYFGAINEPEQGVLYGVPADSNYNQEQCSMKLIYLEYGDRNFDWIKSELKTANERGMGVEFAINMPNQGGDIPYIANGGEEYLNLVADLLASYPRIKYFIRFGAEFDIWENRTNPEEFKAAFRKTADIMHSKVKNAAMVFSPNMVSSWDINAEDYYPGDEYVDWFGMSFYMMKYFQGLANRDESTKYMEVVFGTGESSQPVLLAKDNIDTFGTNKPVMFSESGASHYINALGENAEEWAKTRLEQMYKYIPMVYPQVKLIAHFDQSIPGEINDYSLKNNSEISRLYTSLTSSPVYIKENAYNKASVSYKNLGNTIYTDGSPIELNSYVQVYGKDKFKVSYYIDGKWTAGSQEMPYTKTIDMAPYASGKHTLKVTAEADGKEVYSEEFSIIGSGAADNSGSDEIKVTVDGTKLTFDQPPVIVDGRTLVPLRAIFEALGATVDWDAASRTATATRKNDVISIAIGSKQLYKNGTASTLDVPAQIINDRTMVPARAVAEAFDARVDWDAITRTVIITQ